ncbi:MAG: carbohydrate ABC transporter permease [Granulosicoccus sp.]|nr:carbohydrate ABC transporter permease [Granulosicoccus sp.]
MIKRLRKSAGGNSPVPRGTRPRNILRTRSIVTYGFLLTAAIYWLLPLYVMMVTSLKGLPEIRLGNIFSPPIQVTFEPWAKAWASACTGLNCDGLRSGFANSVKILVPSTLVSIFIASISGYSISFWKFRGSELFFALLLLGAFIPYQIMIYPLVILLRELGLFASVGGIVLIHTVFGMPILTLLFRNYFASLPADVIKAARVDGAGFWTIFALFVVPMSVPIFMVALVLQVTGIWNDFLLSVIYVGTPNFPMTVQLNNIVNSTQGVKEYNVNMAATLLTGLLPLSVYLLSGKFFLREISTGAIR